MPVGLTGLVLHHVSVLAGLAEEERRTIRTFFDKKSLYLSLFWSWSCQCWYERLKRSSFVLCWHVTNWTTTVDSHPLLSLSFWPYCPTCPTWHHLIFRSPKPTPMPMISRATSSIQEQREKRSKKGWWWHGWSMNIAFLQQTSLCQSISNHPNSITISNSER